jgi:hypothetical protein
MSLYLSSVFDGVDAGLCTSLVLASALLEPIQRRSGRGRPIKAAGRAKLDPMHLR